MAELFIAIGGLVGAPTVAGGLTVLGTSVAVAGELQQARAIEAEAKAAQDIADYNANVKEQEAKARRLKAGFEQRRQAKRGERVKSAQVAALGAAGGLGSPVAGDLAAEQAAELELENLLIGFEGEVGARRAESQAELDRFQGKLFRQKGKRQKRAKQIEAGTTLLTGFGEVFT